jgi:hypothetical protein
MELEVERAPDGVGVWTGMGEAAPKVAPSLGASEESPVPSSQGAPPAQQLSPDTATDVFGHYAEPAGTVVETETAAPGGDGAAAMEQGSFETMAQQAVAAEVHKQVAELTPYDELNALDGYRDETGVTGEVPSYGEFGSFHVGTDLELQELTRKVQEQKLAIDGLEAQRRTIIARARADAALAVKNAEAEILRNVASAGVIGGLIAGAGALLLAKNLEIAAIAAALGAAAASAVAQYVEVRKCEAAVRAIVDKAKLDLQPVNAAITFERKRLDSMKRSLAACEDSRKGKPVGELDSQKPVNVKDLPSQRTVNVRELPDARN